MVVTARRVEEVAQEVPIPVSVVRGDLVADAGAFNVNRLKEMLPTVQFYSTNPRNSAINIRGLGAPFGLTNDGIEPGVGLYIDGVFFARPASATLDFLDVEQVEVLRGPQGTLFGKNTTAGAINVTTRKPRFTPGSEVELNYGNFGFVQAKASVTGPLVKNVAGRMSFSGTQRDGVLINTRTGDDINDLNNLGLRGQVLFAPSIAIAVTLAIDHTRQRPQGYTQVVAGVAPTLRPANRQYPQIAADLGYTPPSFNAVRPPDRRGHAAALLSGSGRHVAQHRLEARPRPRDVDDGVSLLGLEAVERPRLHRPADHDDLGGAVVPDAVDAGSALRRRRCRRAQLVAGVFVFRQELDSDPSFKQEQGSAAARFLLAPSANAATPGLLDGYGFDQFLKFGNTSAAASASSNGGHRSPAAAAGPALQLRPEGRGLRSAGLRRAADDQPGADRAAAVGAGAADVHRGRRRHQPLGPVHRRLQGRAARSTPMPPTRPASSRSVST